MGLAKTTFGVAVLSIIFWWNLRGNKFDPDALRGKRVIVTGSSMGIGEQIAYEYSKLGAKVIITARSIDKLRKVAEICKDLGAQQVEIVAADMTVEESRLNVIKAAREKFGGLDILILNHIAYDNADSLDMNHFRNMMEICFISYVDLAKHALPLLKESNGNLGVVSSIAGKLPLRKMGSYSACKFALSGFFGTVRREMVSEKENVSVTIAFLGLIGTEASLEYMKLKNIDDGKATSPESTARAIIEGVSTRVDNIYYPLTARLIAEAYNIIPDLVQNIFEHMYKF